MRPMVWLFGADRSFSPLDLRLTGSCNGFWGCLAHGFANLLLLQLWYDLLSQLDFRVCHIGPKA